MLQWKTPALSALVLLGGGFCALAGEFILRGDHPVTPLKGESAQYSAASEWPALPHPCSAPNAITRRYRQGPS